MYVISKRTIDGSMILSIFVRQLRWHVCLPTTKLLTWYRWQRVGMTIQTRRQWNIKRRPSLRVQPDNLPQIIIRYASKTFLSSFTSSLIGMCVCLTVTSRINNFRFVIYDIFILILLIINFCIL